MRISRKTFLPLEQPQSKNFTKSPNSDRVAEKKSQQCRFLRVDKLWQGLKNEAVAVLPKTACRKQLQKETQKEWSYLGSNSISEWLMRRHFFPLHLLLLNCGKDSVHRYACRPDVFTITHQLGQSKMVSRRHQLHNRKSKKVFNFGNNYNHCQNIDLYRSFLQENKNCLEYRKTFKNAVFCKKADSPLKRLRHKYGVSGIHPRKEIPWRQETVLAAHWTPQSVFAHPCSHSTVFGIGLRNRSRRSDAQKRKHLQRGTPHPPWLDRSAGNVISSSRLIPVWREELDRTRRDHWWFWTTGIEWLDRFDIAPLNWIKPEQSGS